MRAELRFITSVVLGLVLAAGVGAGLALSSSGVGSASTTITNRSTTHTSSGQGVTSPLALPFSVVTINGTTYRSDDVSNQTVVGNPGYSYFRNGSITFLGIQFETICPQSLMGCPRGSYNGSQAIVLAGAFKVRMTFPDGSNDTRGEVIGDSQLVIVLSSHVRPKAGVMIVRVDSDYHAFLLVEGSSPTGGS